MTSCSLLGIPIANAKSSIWVILLLGCCHHAIREFFMEIHLLVVYLLKENRFISTTYDRGIDLLLLMFVERNRESDSKGYWYNEENNKNTEFQDIVSYHLHSFTCVIPSEKQRVGVPQVYLAKCNERQTMS